MGEKLVKRFILWDPKDGEPRRNDDGDIDSDGLTGLIGEDNVYLTTYASYREGLRNNHKGLKVGEYAIATFSLSGTKGTYQIWRVQ